MLFNSFAFLVVFLPIVLVATRLIGARRPRMIFWTLASYVFYGLAGFGWLALMLASTVVDFVIARRIHAARSPRVRTALLVTSIAFGVSLLAFFKYFNFLLGTANGITAFLHAVTGLPAVHLATAMEIALPAGISFYTFETMSYTIDVYRREIEPEPDFWYFCCFVSLFPHLIAGPIMRAGDLITQLRSLPDRHRGDYAEGLLLFGAGLVKKVLIADRIARQIDPVLADVASASTPVVWLAMLGFAMQIYFDFSAYTDMARGLARLLGLRFPVNFNSPYWALDPRDFWQRWHITLSSWLRDYVYVPLGGNRGSAWATSRNLFATMLLGGLWHGASWNFVLWGGLHGAALALHRRYEAPWSRLPVVVRRAATFTFVLLAWVPFRLHSFQETMVCYGKMFALDFTGPPSARLVGFTLVATAIALLVRRNSNVIDWRRLHPAAAAALGLLVFVSLLYMNLSGAFLYFQF